MSLLVRSADLQLYLYIFCPSSMLAFLSSVCVTPCLRIWYMPSTPGEVITKDPPIMTTHSLTHSWSTAFLCSFSARNALKNAASDDVFAPLDAGPPDLILNHPLECEPACLWCQVIGPARALIELLAWIHMMHPDVSLNICVSLGGLMQLSSPSPQCSYECLVTFFSLILWLFGLIQSWEPGVSLNSDPKASWWWHLWPCCLFLVGILACWDFCVQNIPPQINKPCSSPSQETADFRSQQLSVSWCTAPKPISHLLPYQFARSYDSRKLHLFVRSIHLLGSFVQTFARQVMILVVKNSFKAGMIWCYPSGCLGLGHLCLAAEIAAVLLVHALLLRGLSSRCMKVGLHQVSSLVLLSASRLEYFLKWEYIDTIYIWPIYIHTS